MQNEFEDGPCIPHRKRKIFLQGIDPFLKFEFTLYNIHNISEKFETNNYFLRLLMFCTSSIIYIHFHMYGFNYYYFIIFVSVSERVKFSIVSALVMV